MDLAEKLSYETKELTELFSSRLQSLRKLSGAGSAVLSEPKPELSLLREGLAYGVDGSMDYDEHMELLLFYVAAAAYSCPLRRADGAAQFDKKNVKREASMTFSTAVPLWSDDASNLIGDTAATPGYAGVEELSGAQRIPFALMTMAEQALSLRLLERADAAALFLDRPLSGTYLPLARDLRYLLRSKSSVLVGQPTPFGELSWLDIGLASVLGPPQTYVPPRRPYTPYAALGAIIRAQREGAELTPQALARLLSLDDGALKKMLEWLVKFDERHGGTLFEELSPTRLAVSRQASLYWERVMHVAGQVVDKIFGGGASHPLLYGGDRWLTVFDVNALNSFLVLELVRRANAQGVLLVGITKDTSATDYMRSALPYLSSRGALSLSPQASTFKSDTAFLAILSAANHAQIRTPWRTHAYDACFSSLTAQPDGKLRAARGRASRERLFVKAYFQLRTFRGDGSMRSPVFGYERPYNPELDGGLTVELEVEERGGVTRLSPFAEVGGRSKLDDLVLHVLSRGDNPEVLEAYGHNLLLFLADKAVKAEVKLMRATLRAIANHELSGFERKERIFLVSRRFRELRAELERERRSQAEGSEGEEQ